MRLALEARAQAPGTAAPWAGGSTDGQEEAPSLPYPPRPEPKVQVPQAQSPRRFLIGSWILYTDFIAFLYNSRLSESEGTLENISSTPPAPRPRRGGSEPRG